jgi:hypothetical protein
MPVLGFRGLDVLREKECLSDILLSPGSDSNLKHPEAKSDGTGPRTHCERYQDGETELTYTLILATHCIEINHRSRSLVLSDVPLPGRRSCNSRLK